MKHVITINDNISIVVKTMFASTLAKNRKFMMKIIDLFF